MFEAKTFGLVTDQNDSRLSARQMAVVERLRHSLIPLLCPIDFDGVIPTEAVDANISSFAPLFREGHLTLHVRT
jgi:hypothetical protein